MSEEIKRSVSYEIEDPSSGAKVELSRLPTGNYRIIHNTQDGEFSEEMWENLWLAMKDIYNNN